MNKAIKFAVKKLNQSIGNNPIEESELNLYIHNICSETIQELKLNISSTKMTKKYLQFFDKVKDSFLNA